MILIKRAEIFKHSVPGWSPFVTTDGKHTAAMVCPTCNRAFHIGDHAIDPSGMISPSVVCGHKDQGCTFHDYVQLEGWP